MHIAGKTGTTNDNYDRYFTGYTPYYCAAVWVGYAKNERISYSVNPAASLWRQVMEKVHADLPDKSFSKPSSGLTTVTVCADSGMLVTDACRADPRQDRVVTYEVAVGTEPKEECTLHKMVDICTEGNCLAGEFCPAESVVQQGYLDYVREDYGESITASDDAYLISTLEEAVAATETSPGAVPSTLLPRPRTRMTLTPDWIPVIPTGSLRIPMTRAPPQIRARRGRIPPAAERSLRSRILRIPPAASETPARTGGAASGTAAPEHEQQRPGICRAAVLLPAVSRRSRWKRATGCGILLLGAAGAPEGRDTGRRRRRADRQAPPDKAEASRPAAGGPGPEKKILKKEFHMEQRFTGGNEYVASAELMNAVNIAITLQKPLLVKGEPGTERPCWPRRWRTLWASG